MQIKYASFGSVSTATLRPQDLLASFASAIDDNLARNWRHFALPENVATFDRLTALVKEAKNLNGDGIESDFRIADIEELIAETLPDALNEFAPPYAYFGAHPGDGADFGFWLFEIDDIREQVEFTSTRKQEYPADDFSGEWLHVNERGNCTLYIRTNGEDREIWSIA